MEIIRRPIRALAVAPDWAQRELVGTHTETLLAIERINGAGMIAEAGIRTIGRVSVREAEMLESARFADGHYGEIVQRVADTVAIEQQRYALRCSR